MFALLSTDACFMTQDLELTLKHFNMRLFKGMIVVGLLCIILSMFWNLFYVTI